MARNSAFVRVGHHQDFGWRYQRTIFRELGALPGGQFGVKQRISAPCRPAKNLVVIMTGKDLQGPSAAASYTEMPVRNGEMSEWLKEHAWKSIPATLTKSR